VTHDETRRAANLVSVESTAVRTGAAPVVAVRDRLRTLPIRILNINIVQRRVVPVNAQRPRCIVGAGRTSSSRCSDYDLVSGV
jgi:hypothetical protein